MQFRVTMVTDPHTHTKKPRQDQLQYATPLSLARNVTTAEHYKPGNNIISNNITLANYADK